MEWTDDAIILGTRQHGESAVLLEVMTRSHGRHLGLVRGGRSKRLQPMLQSGNSVRVTWRARLESHMGQFTPELTQSRAALLMATPLGSYGVQFIAALTRLLPERNPQPYLYQALDVIVDEFKEGDVAGELMVRYELALLSELGFGLSLDQCAATGRTDDLVYVSPRSGRAISRDAGQPYHDRMLLLPAFLRGEAATNRLSFEEIRQGFKLSGFFLDKYVYGPSDGTPGGRAPAFRDSFIEAVRRDLALED